MHSKGKHKQNEKTSHRMRKKKLFANSTNDKATGHAAQLKKKKSQLKNGQT